MKCESILERIKKLLRIKGAGIVAIGIAAGLILMLFPFSEGEAEPIPTESGGSSTEYCAILEQKAEQLIKQLPKVNDCNVFITLESGFRYVYATDQHINETSSSKETDKTIVLAGNGSGEAPILIEETMPKVAGVAVVCRGADYETQYRIIELLCALFEIKSNRICVQT